MALYVTVTRYWHRPEIITSVTNTEIGIAIKLEDFLAAIEVEMGAGKTLRDAAESVVKMMKRETTKTI